MELPNNENDLAYFTYQCSESVSFFIENVLEYKLSKVHKEMLDSVVQNRYLAVEIPVGHSKTTTISKGYALWRLWKETKYEICLTSSSLEQSMKILSEIQYILETNPFLKPILPDNRETTWNKKQLTTRKQTTMYVKPFNDSARGIHPDLLIYDDILRVGDSDLTADDIKDIFWSVFIPRGQTKRSQHVLVGTPRGVGDLFDDIEQKSKSGKIWKHIRYACITKVKPYGNVNNPDDWTETLWPERFTINELKEIRENISPGRFAREYLCDPSAEGASMFSQDKLAKGLDHDSEFSYTRKKGNCIIGLDIAFSQEASSDWTVITVTNQLEGNYKVVQYIDGETKENIIEQPIFIERIVRHHGINPQLVKEMYDIYEASKIILDKSTGGVLVAKDLRQMGCNIDEQAFDSSSRKMMLLNLWKIIDQGRLVFPYKENGNSEQLVKELLYELKGMQSSKTRNDTETFESTTKHDDCVMSLALSLRDFQKRITYSENMVFSADKDGNITKQGTEPKNNEMHTTKVVPVAWQP